MSNDPMIGRTLAAYRIERKLGEGGMGAVYLAHHDRLKRDVALKILPRRMVEENRGFVDRFLLEAKAAARISHPNVVRVYDAQEAEGVHFIAMEYVEGDSLKDHIDRRGALKELEAVKIVQQAAKGLRAAREEKVIHRDIKPANLMIAAKGLVKVADFGLAKNLSAGAQLTQSGDILGTPTYMSPEQAAGEQADFQSDIYSLGVTFFEAATGEKPYTSETPLALLMLHNTAPVPDPIERRPDLHPDFQTIIMKMMAKAPGDRHASYKALDRDLARLRASLESGERPAAATVRRRKPVKLDVSTPKTIPREKALAGDTQQARPGRRPPGAVPRQGLPPWVWILGTATVLIGIAAILWAGGIFEDTTPPTPPAPRPKKMRTPPSGEPSLREVLERAERLESEGRLDEALAALTRAAVLDPDNIRVKKLRHSLETRIERDRKGRTREEAYQMYWTAADACKTQAEARNTPADWERVVEAAEKACAQRSTEAALDLLIYAKARRDWAFARSSEKKGELPEALRLGQAAREHGAALKGLDEYLKGLKKAIAAETRRADRKARYDTLSDAARRLEGQGATSEEVLAAWEKALAEADEDEDQKAAQQGIARGREAVAFKKTLAEAVRAEQAGDLSKAQALLEKALEGRPKDGEALAALARVNARIEETEGKARRAEKARERKKRCEALMAKAQKLERARADTWSVLDQWRKALELADETRMRKKIETRVRGLSKRLFREAMDRGKAWEARKGWMAARAAYEEALKLSPEDAKALAGLERAKKMLAPFLSQVGSVFLIPKADKDQFGNPVCLRDGLRHDPASGWPLELWLATPRVEFILIPSGSFQMGSPKEEEGCKENEGPRHKVTLARPFYLAKYELTQKTWKAVMGDCKAAFANRPRNPMENINWEEAQDFISKMRTKNLAAVADTILLRLPSEAEWEYACRAGTRTRYACGDSDKELLAAAWMVSNGEDRPHEVGWKKPNPWGVYDMHGNVWEWVEDVWQATHRGSPADGSARTEGDPAYHPIKGGAFNSENPTARAPRRFQNPVHHRVSTVGFRLYMWPMAR